MIEESHSEVLGIMARRRPLPEVLTAICVSIEAHHEGTVASVLLVDPSGRRLTVGAAPSLPEAYRSACEGIEIGPDAGSCGTAAHRGEMVVIEDIAADPLCENCRERALPDRLRACWAHPVFCGKGSVVGVIALYRDRPARPTPEEVQEVRGFADLVSIAIRHQKTRDKRRETEDHLNNLVMNVPGMVFQWFIDDDGAFAVSFLSDNAARFLDLPDCGTADDPDLLLRCFHPDDLSACIAALQESTRTFEPVTHDVRTRDGERWLRIRSRPRRRSDGSVVSEAIGVDITDRMAVERTLEDSQNRMRAQLAEVHRTKARLETQTRMLVQTANDLSRARDLAEEANRAKSDFLSNMSHELRTPLNAIIGFSEIIKDQLLGPVGTPRYRDYARDICEAGRHLLELINDILDFSKAESGNAGLNEEVVDVPRAVTAVVSMLRETAAKASVTVETDLPADLPALRADERKLKQILINLLSNAIKFTEAGGRVTVKCWCRGDSGYVFQVADTGIGIALADIQQALRLFGQIDSPFNRRHQGTGLGLPLSKSFAELHGGSLDLQSQPGVGTTVTVRLPSERVLWQTDGDKLAAAGE